MMAESRETAFAVPDGLSGVWTWDRAHYPRPLTPLTAEILIQAMSDGFCQAMDEYASPFGIAFRVINGYGYGGSVPLGSGHEDPAARRQRYLVNQAETFPRIPRIWEQEWLPSVQAGIARARSVDYAAFADSALLLIFDELRRDLLDRWRIHGWLLPHYIAPARLVDFYNGALRPDDPMEPYLLLHGFATRATESSRGLWRLSRALKASPLLARLFRTSASEELFDRLQASRAGREWLRDLRAYLEEFGWRSDCNFELSLPTWREDPSVPLNAIRGYLDASDDGDPDARLATAARLRERLLAAARARLATEPDQLKRFEALYEQARPHLEIDENHNFFIDQMGNAVLRLPLLEIGRRLVRAGAVVTTEDVFFLQVAELPDGLVGTDHRALVAGRRAQHAAWAKLTPPLQLGEPDPNEAPADALTDAMSRMDGTPPAPSTDPLLVAGTPGAPGVVSGRARVARSLDEASAIEPGEVLVCETTLPPWTPFFSLAVAVVADSGGVLSHCAIVAREYGIPCVVGTATGTAVIRSGMLLTVDGTHGLVRIEEG